MSFTDMLVLPFTIAVGYQTAAYALAGIGLNVQFGYTGLLNFGHVAFMLVGAYGTAISITKWGWPTGAGIVFGIACAVVLGLILGASTLRLRADYLAIVTIAVAQIVDLVVNAAPSKPVTNAGEGIRDFSTSFLDINPIHTGHYGWGQFSFDQAQLWLMLVGWALVAVLSLFVWALMRSPWGRVLKSIREDEDAARALGKNVFSYKLQSLVVGGAIAAVAGLLIAFQANYTDATDWVPEFTFYIYTLVILGGAARIAGPIIGAFIFWWLLEFSDDFLKWSLGSHIDTLVLGAVRFGLVGAGLMALMIFRPQGIFGDRKELMLDER